MSGTGVLQSCLTFRLRYRGVGNNEDIWRFKIHTVVFDAIPIALLSVRFRCYCSDIVPISTHIQREFTKKFEWTRTIIAAASSSHKSKLVLLA